MWTHLIKRSWRFSVIYRIIVVIISWEDEMLYLYYALIWSGIAAAGCIASGVTLADYGLLASALPLTGTIVSIGLIFVNLSWSVIPDPEYEVASAYGL